MRGCLQLKCRQHDAKPKFHRSFLFSVVLLCLVTSCSNGARSELLDLPIGGVSTPGPPRFDSSLVADFNDTELGRRIRQDHLNKLRNYDQQWELTIDDVRIRESYGTYNGCVVVTLTDGRGGPDMITHFVVAGILFQDIGGGIQFVAWKEGRVYAWHEAYSLGLLAREDLVDISKRIIPDLPYDYYLDGNHVGLSVRVEEFIKQWYLYRLSRNSDVDITVDDVWIEAYYGSYNNYAVVMMGDGYHNYINAERIINIDGVLFRYSSENSIVIWGCYRNFMELQDAYDRGLLTRENIMDIADYHNQVFYPKNPVY